MSCRPLTQHRAEKHSTYSDTAPPLSQTSECSLLHGTPMTRPSLAEVLGNFVTRFSRGWTFLPTSCSSFPASSDCRIIPKDVLSLSLSRCLSASALFASQHPSQSERIFNPRLPSGGHPS